MKALFITATLTLVALWLLQTSKTTEWIPYTERLAGVVKVQKTRFEWHPERLIPFIKTLPEKTRQFLKEGLDRFRRRDVFEEPSGVVLVGNLTPIRLKSGRGLS